MTNRYTAADLDCLTVARTPCEPLLVADMCDGYAVASLSCFPRGDERCDSLIVVDSTSPSLKPFTLQGRYFKNLKKMIEDANGTVTREFYSIASARASARRVYRDLVPALHLHQFRVPATDSDAVRQDTVSVEFDRANNRYFALQSQYLTRSGQRITQNILRQRSFTADTVGELARSLTKMIGVDREGMSDEGRHVGILSRRDAGRLITADSVERIARLCCRRAGVAFARPVSPRLTDATAGPLAF